MRITLDYYYRLALRGNNGDFFLRRYKTNVHLRTRVLSSAAEVY